jgi:hypothetical protein
MTMIVGDSVKKNAVHHQAFPGAYHRGRIGRVLSFSKSGVVAYVQWPGCKTVESIAVDFLEQATPPQEVCEQDTMAL